MDKPSKSPLTLDQLRAKRGDILALAAKNHAYNVRIVGSLARGEATRQSDVDFLVSFQAGSSIFDQIGLWLDLQELLGYDVDLLTDHPEAGQITVHARLEAVPL